MSFDARSLFELLPAIHRIRDAELARSLGLECGPLEELIEVLAEQITVAEEGLEQLHDDLFIETCAEWLVPYIGDLIGYQGIHGVSESVASSRAAVAHTIALRRRKGTALALEQLARDVTGWEARAVEYFQRLITTQHMNHLRPHHHQSPDLRDSEALEWMGTAFEAAGRSVDVRSIGSGRGRHNIPHVGLHLWRIRAFRHLQAQAARVRSGRYRVSPLNHDLPLYNRPLPEEAISHPAEPDNVPGPISRRRLADHPQRYYPGSDGRLAGGAPPSLEVFVNGAPIPIDGIRSCHLGDHGTDWGHTPPPSGVVAIDPVLGRIALPPEVADSDADPADVRVTWQEGFCDVIGGGEYERGDSLPLPPDGVPVLQVPSATHSSLSQAIAAIEGTTIIEIIDNGIHDDSIAITVPADTSVEIRASNGRRPTLRLADFSVIGGVRSSLILNGLLISGAPLRSPVAAGNELATLQLIHCTLVPGISLTTEGSPAQPTEASLQLAPEGLDIHLDRCIVGPVRSHRRAQVRIHRSIIDATDRDGTAYASSDPADADGPGATLQIEDSTLIGRVHATHLEVSNSILLAGGDSTAAADAPVRAVRRQSGCVRFSWLPFESIVPRRFRCQPDSAEAAWRLVPLFSSLRYGTPAYAQLSADSPEEILRGADDESEMGVFHPLKGALRETDLRIRMTEYLRLGLSAGIFYES